MTAAVLDALLEAQGQRLERVLDIHQRFTRIALAGGGAAEIASTLHDLLGCPVAVFDADGRHDRRRTPRRRRRLDVAAAPAVRQPIRAGDHEYGEIVALTEGAAFDEDQLVALERASMAIAVRLAQASAVAEAQERFAAISLEELIAGHAGDAADVAERAISFGWDLGRPRAVLLASIDPPTCARHPARALWRRSRQPPGRRSVAMPSSGRVAPRSRHWSPRRRMSPANGVASRKGLRHELDERVQLGHGQHRRRTAGRPTPPTLPRSFLEASRAVDVGRWAKGRHVTEVFDELGLERLLASAPADDLAEFVEHAIGPLVDHDRANDSDLVETLEVWLETRNMAEAARRTHVHYNTLKNRLERIETILGPVMTDAARSLECEVAIYVARHYDGPWSTEPDAVEPANRD